jgi:transcriptional regulator of acetoin/glycerol metabolism
MHNVLRTAVALLGDRNEITDDDLSGDFLEQAGPADGMEQALRPDTSENSGDALLADMEARLISSTLDQTGGNIAAAARKMGIGRNTLYRKLRNLVPGDNQASAHDQV